jgi:hypothetical protein
MNPELTILRTLQPNYPRGLRENVLRCELPNYGGALSLTDLRRHCANLEAKGHVSVIDAQDFTLIKITPDGLARLAESE